MVENMGSSYMDDDLLDEEDEDTQKDKYLTFELGDEDYGIEIRHVTEIIGMQKVTDVPDMPGFVKGVINLRGRVIPVIDVRSRFRMESREYDDRTCVVIVSVQENSIGLVVDTVKEVTPIPEQQISPPPQVHKSPGSRYIQGMGRVGDSVKILLDVNKLLYEEEMEELARAGQE